MFRLSRCIVLALSFGFISQAVMAEEPEWRHATALTGSPKYKADFQHFDYVNPNAPKGGLVRLATSAPFDTFNPFLQKGNLAPGLSLMNERLMTSSLDEFDISAEYGLIASAIRYPDDASWVEFKLNPKARWHDGTQITAEDVIWSFNQVVKLDPRERAYYHNVEKAEVLAPDLVRFTFNVKNNRELPHIMGQVRVLARHWWQGTNEKGEQRSIEKGTLEPPLGSGPYRIGAFVPGKSLTFERVDDYWAKDLPVGKGQYNFDKIRFGVHLDAQVLVEAFKGDQYDYRSENSAKNWATQYKFPAVKDGRVVLEEFDDKGSGVMQAFVLNLRLDKFKDPKVRQALNYAFDFEALKDRVFFGQYKRIGSYFAGTELASSGVPKGKELEILETVRGKISDDVFTTPYQNPVGGDRTKARQNLRKAVQLLKKAGWVLKSGKLVNAETGKPFTIEYIYQSPSSERVALPYQKALRRIGIEMTLRFVDSAQYQNRIRNRDFDMATLGWRQSLSPGNEQRDFWGSAAADQNNSRNYGGIKDPAIDALIDQVVFAKDRETLIAATHALDRVLLWSEFVIPQWYIDYERTARWNRFSFPEKASPYTNGFPTTWWYDEAKAEKTGKAR